MRWMRYRKKNDKGEFVGYAKDTIASDRGRYCILRTRAGYTGGMACPPPERFIAFKGFSGDRTQRVLGGFTTAEAAKEACAKDREIT